MVEVVSTDEVAGGEFPGRGNGTRTAARPRARAAAGDRSIYEAIYDAVMDHRLPPGTRLPEATISAWFGVGRPVVRKVLVRLAHERIVDFRPNRSAVVASPSVEETREVFEARRVVESAVVRAVAAGASRDQLDRLRAMVHEEQDAYERGDRRRWVRLSGMFHVHLAEIGRNAVLARLLNELVSRTSLIIALYEAPGKAACSYHEHRALIESVARGDGEEAAATMLRHLDDCERRLNLQQSGEPVDLAEVFGAPGPE